MSDEKLSEITKLIHRYLSENPGEPSYPSALMNKLLGDHSELDPSELRTTLWYLASRGEIEFGSDWRIERAAEPAAG